MPWLAAALRRRTDVDRWADVQSLDHAWEDRTVRLSALIPPHSRVLEFGAGRMRLREHLPPGCTYVASKLVAHGPDVLVCDLNAPQLPDLPETDVVVFGGVLEFVNDVPRLLAYLHPRCRLVVASYAPSHNDRLRSRVHRRAEGWANDYTGDRLVGLFLRHGFYPVEEEAWRDQRLYKFRKLNVRPVSVRPASVRD